MNVDNIEIKPKEVDFNKMVEEELAKLGDNPNMDTQATPNKPKIKYERKTEKYLEKYKVSKPTETKQYKYYTDNFEKENDSTYVRDGVHPTAAGSYLIAKRWIETFEKLEKLKNNIKI